MTVAQVLSLFNSDTKIDFYFKMQDDSLYLLETIQGAHYSNLNDTYYFCDMNTEEIEVNGETYLTNSVILLPYTIYMEKEVYHIEIVDSEYIEIYASY